MPMPRLRPRNRAGFIAAALAAWLAGAGGTIACAQTEPDMPRYEFSQVHMGVPIKLVLYAPDESSANRAAAAAFARIAHLDRTVMSDYQADSELSRLGDTAGSGKAILVSNDLWPVLWHGQQLAQQTGGAFDITVGPMVRLWRRARRSREFPSGSRLAEARSATGYRHLELTLADRTARLKVPGMRLDLGGIGMGYAADEALAVLRRHGVNRALVDASGDLAAGDPPPGQAGWRIGFAYGGPESETATRYALLANAALTTSGDMYQYVEFDGVRYSHIVDPRTGLGLTDQSTVTVIAPTCIQADSLATALSVLGPEAGLGLIESTPQAAAFVQRMVNGQPHIYVSRRLPQYEVPIAPTPPPPE